MTKNLLIGLSVTIIAFAMLVPVAMAQEPTATPMAGETLAEPQLTDEALNINEAPDIEAELEAKKVTYRALFATYLTTEREFSIAKQQYKQLNTLASLETAVKAGRVALVARNEVLLAYFDILDLSLRDAQGIEVSLKEQAIEDLTQLTADVETYGQIVDRIESRDDLAGAVLSFVSLRPRVEEVSYRVLSLLSIGRLRVVYDRTNAATMELQSTSADATNPLRQAERDRAFVETFRALDTAQGLFTEVDTEFVSHAGRHNSSTFNQVVRNLTPAFTQLSQVLSYLEELIKGSV